jgi:hypothetical protein
MATPLPKTVRDAWGEQAAGEFAGWLEALLQERTVTRSEWHDLGERYTGSEARLDRVEVRLENLARELGDLKLEVRALRTAMEERLDRQAAQFDLRFDSLSHELNRRMDDLQRLMVVQTRWSIGILALFGTMVTVLLTIQTLRP